MSYRIEINTPPAVEPIDLATAKAHLKIRYDDDDFLIVALITAARTWCETQVSRTFITTTYDCWADTWDDLVKERYGSMSLWLLNGAIWLPRAPLQRINSVQYLQADGTYATWDPSQYVVSTGTPGRVAPIWGRIFPILSRFQTDIVHINYTAGYGDTGGEVPPAVRQAILMIVAQLYEQRTETTPEAINEVPFAAKALLSTVDAGIYT